MKNTVHKSLVKRHPAHFLPLCRRKMQRETLVLQVMRKKNYCVNCSGETPSQLFFLSFRKMRKVTLRLIVYENNMEKSMLPEETSDRSMKEHTIEECKKTTVLYYERSGYSCTKQIKQEL